MNLTIDSLFNPMRKENIGFDLLITKVTVSPGRYLLMKHSRLLPDLLLEMPTKLLLTSGSTHQKWRINHKIRHLKCLFMVGLMLVEKHVLTIGLISYLQRSRCSCSLLCLPNLDELLVYMYLSQLMSIFTKLSKRALSSRWFLLPET